jgi:hypothetical protein
MTYYAEYSEVLTIWQEYAILQPHFAALAQLDRASVFGTEGRGFESLTPHHRAELGFDEYE